MTWRARLFWGALGSLALLAILWRPDPPPPAWAQGVGIFSRATCTAWSGAVTGQSFCFEQSTNTFKVWTGARWQAGTATQTGVNNVIDFGADPSGVSDSAAAIQAALNVALSLGQTVYIPQGVYRLSTGLTTLGGSKIIGAGRPYTRLRYYGTGGALLTIQNNGYQHTSISDLTFENSGTGTTVGIDVFYTFVTMERITVGAFDAGTTGFTTGIRYNNINGKTFENLLSFSYILQNATGVELNNTDYTTIFRSRIENNETGVLWATATGVSILASDITGSYLVNGAGHVGVDIRSASAWTIRDSAFETDLSQSGTVANAVGIRLGTVSTINGVIEGNWMNGSGSSDVMIDATNTAANITNVRISDNYILRTNTFLQGPANLMAALHLGPNFPLGLTCYLRVNSVCDPRASYSTYNGYTIAPWRSDAPVLLGTSTVLNATTGDLVATFGRGVRSTSAAGANTFRTIDRSTLFGTESVVVAGDGDFTNFGSGVGIGNVTNQGTGTLNVASSVSLNAQPALVASAASPNLTNIRGISASHSLSNNLRGTCNFQAAATCVTNFGANEPDAHYFVALSCSGTNPIGLGSKTRAGFTLTATVSNSNTCDYLLVR